MCKKKKKRVGGILASMSVCVLDSDLVRGKGVFATSDLPKGAVVGAYGGKLISRIQAQEIWNSGCNWQYLKGVDRDWCIDGAAACADGFFLAQMVNSVGYGVPRSMLNAKLVNMTTKDLQKRIGRVVADKRSVDNSTNRRVTQASSKNIVPPRVHVVLQTTRNVAKGSELFVDYGSQYFKHFKRCTLYRKMTGASPPE